MGVSGATGQGGRQQWQVLPYVCALASVENGDASAHRPSTADASGQTRPRTAGTTGGHRRATAHGALEQREHGPPPQRTWPLVMAMASIISFWLNTEDTGTAFSSRS